MTTAVLTGLKASSRPIASRTHTLLLVTFFFAMSAVGIILQHRAGSRPDLVEVRPNVIPLYFSLIAAEWGLVYWVWKGGLRPNGISLAEMIGGKWTSVRSFGKEALLALGAWVFWQGIAFCWSAWFGAHHAQSIDSLTPQHLTEAVLWIALSISAGFCEELVFRGYLQRQFTALFGTPLAIVLQSALFGIVHGYQGFQNCLIVSLYGAMVTGLTLWRKNLPPGPISPAVC